MSRNGEYNPDSQGFVTDPNGWRLALMSDAGHKWKRALWAPWFHKHGEGKNPSVYITLAMCLITVIFAMVYGVLFLGAYHAALTSVPAVSPFIISFILGIIAFGATYMFANLSRDGDVKLYPSIGTLFAAWFTFKNIGFFAVLLFGACNMGGFAAAGGIARALGFTGAGTSLASAATSASSYALAFFGATIISFVWIYCDNLEQSNENERENHRRFTLLSSLAVMIFTIGFFNYGIVSYNPGLWLAGAIASNNFSATFGGDSVVVAAFWTLVPFLASGAAAGLMYIGFDALGYGNHKLDEKRPVADDEAETFGDDTGPYNIAPGATMASARRVNGYCGSSRLRKKRTPVVDF